MTITGQARVRRTIRHLRQIWAEMDYAQRRLLELRTGMSFDARPERRRVSENH